MKNIKWKIFQAVQAIIFVIVAIFLLTRSIDGHGAVQTIDAKIISLLVLVGFYLLILAIELGIYFGVKKK